MGIGISDAGINGGTIKMVRAAKKKKKEEETTVTLKRKKTGEVVGTKTLTPEQVRRSKEREIPEPTAPTEPKAKIKAAPEPTKPTTPTQPPVTTEPPKPSLFNAFPQAKEAGQLRTGSLPLVPGAGAAAAAVGKVADIIKGGQIQGIKAFSQSATGAYTRPAGTAQIVGFSKTGFKRAGKLLLKFDGSLRKLFQSPIVRFGVGAGTATAGVGGIMTWLASDNIMSGAAIFANKVADLVTFSGLDRSTALALIDEEQEFVDTARSFVNTATMINPVMWPFRNIVITNADVAQNGIDLARNSISGTLETPEEEETPEA